ncbi:MAG: squalene/phytoene synthase family protein [Dokdonella sp.]|uniref:squalene/phytoene synthase family protein n=1 Tax=Dokdonella sp. TaxID=2291710 RepID=UPI003267EAC4
MNVVGETTPLASFEAKWSDSTPEFRLGLTFLAAVERRAHGAFACLAFELEYTAFGIREAEPAAIKLQWWAEEFARAANREARHPLTQTLAVHPRFSDIPLARWHEVIVGALGQRDAEPAADPAALLDAYGALYRPLCATESILFPSVDASAMTRVRSLARSIRETAALGDTLRDGRLPIPLDLLARHRLARGDLSRESPVQAAALRDWFATLGREYSGTSRAVSGPLGAASARADMWRARRAARAADPLKSVNQSLTRLPLQTSWAAWRAARRSRP